MPQYCGTLPTSRSVGYTDEYSRKARDTSPSFNALVAMWYRSFGGLSAVFGSRPMRSLSSFDSRIISRCLCSSARTSSVCFSSTAALVTSTSLASIGRCAFSSGVRLSEFWYTRLASLVRPIAASTFPLRYRALPAITWPSGHWQTISSASASASSSRSNASRAADRLPSIAGTSSPIGFAWDSARV